MMNFLNVLRNKMNLDIEKESTKILVLLLSADIFFIALHILYLFYNYRGILGSVWSIETDRGLAESYQYVKEYWIIMMLSWIAIRNLRFSLLSWATVFTYILIDDMFELHERFGDKLSSFFHYTSFWGLRAEDLGEVSFFMIFGFIFSILIGFVYYRNRKDDILKNINRRFIYIIAFLSCFGVGMDAVHSMAARLLSILGWPHSLKLIVFFGLGILEDGGEMVVMSVACWYVFLLTSRIRRVE